jgi:DNA-binding NarL/FixJ family response regulator
MATKLLLADDHQMFRSGLRALLANEKDMEVVAEADNGRDAVRLIEEVNPDVAIMDINMPGLNGIEATRQVVVQGGPVKIIALSAHADHRFAQQILKAGASGYVLKDAAFEEPQPAHRLGRAGQLRPPGRRRECHGLQHALATRARSASAVSRGEGDEGSGCAFETER